MFDESYETPVLTDLGAFAAKTGKYDERNNDEIVWFFDNWG